MLFACPRGGGSRAPTSSELVAFPGAYEKSQPGIVWDVGSGKAYPIRELSAIHRQNHKLMLLYSAGPKLYGSGGGSSSPAPVNPPAADAPAPIRQSTTSIPAVSTSRVTSKTSTKASSTARPVQTTSLPAQRPVTSSRSTTQVVAPITRVTPTRPVATPTKQTSAAAPGATKVVYKDYNECM